MNSNIQNNKCKHLTAKLRTLLSIKSLSQRCSNCNVLLVRTNKSTWVFATVGGLFGALPGITWVFFHSFLLGVSLSLIIGIILILFVPGTVKKIH